MFFPSLFVVFIDVIFSAKFFFLSFRSICIIFLYFRVSFRQLIKSLDIGNGFLMIQTKKWMKLSLKSCLSIFQRSGQVLIKWLNRYNWLCPDSKNMYFRLCEKCFDVKRPVSCFCGRKYKYMNCVINTNTLSPLIQIRDTFGFIFRRITI